MTTKVNNSDKPRVGRARNLTPEESNNEFIKCGTIASVVALPRGDTWRNEQIEVIAEYFPLFR